MSLERAWLGLKLRSSLRFVVTVANLTSNYQSQKEQHSVQSMKNHLSEVPSSIDDVFLIVIPGLRPYFETGEANIQIGK